MSGDAERLKRSRPSRQQLRETIDTIARALHPEWTDPEARHTYAVDDLLRRIERLRGERDEARQWVRDLHSGMWINCVYCGHRYGPKAQTPVSMANVLKQHAETCPQHPMSALREERDEARTALEKLKRETASKQGCAMACTQDTVSGDRDDRITAALDLAVRYGQIDGELHKTWVIDQMVRALTGDGYEKWIADANDGEDGPDTYSWDEGIPP